MKRMISQLFFVLKKNFKQNPDQNPINFPPNKTIFCGRNKDGIKIIEIKIIPEKKNNENRIFLIILKVTSNFLDSVFY